MNQGLVTLAFAGVEVNMVLFSKLVLRQTNAEAASTFGAWMGTVYLFSLGGAFLSDSYLGRYLTCVIFQVVYIIVSIMLLLLSSLLSICLFPFLVSEPTLHVCSTCGRNILNLN